MAKKVKPFLCHRKNGKFISSKYLHNQGAAPDGPADPAPKNEFDRFSLNFEKAIKKAVIKSRGAGTPAVRDTS
jgi:hypothetical protein